MSQEINDLLEIDSYNIGINNTKNPNKQIVYRTLIPFLVFLYGLIAIIISDNQGPSGEYFVCGAIIILILLVYLIEMIYYFVTNKIELAIMNLKVFGLLIILTIIVCILNVISMFYK